MNFKNAEELLDICNASGKKISEIMLEREITVGEKSETDVLDRMRRALDIMRSSSHSAITDPKKSIGGLIGGESKLIFDGIGKRKTACGDMMARGIAYAMSVLEVNARMGLIVASPTAGSSGVVPGVLFALQDEYGFSDGELLSALFNAGAIGYLAMKNATVAGAVGGCQAEVGVAAAMAASAACELMSGTPQQSLDAASLVLMNMLGLACDPVNGLVEYPCQNRNASGVANALIASEMSLSGIRQHIPFDEMLEIMYRVGRSMPAEIKETALGGCAASKSACEICEGCSQG